MQYEALKEAVLKRLDEDLSKTLYYHSARHTRDVLAVCEKKSQLFSLSEEAKTLLLSAALLHDAGFLNTIKDHEEEGVHLASILLPDFDYSEDQIDQIAGMIMATKIPQNPNTLLERIICDADLDYLGRDDFYAIGKTLFLELKEHGVVSTEKEWDALQVKFLSGHTYHTDASSQERGPKKKKYLEELLKKWK